MSAVASCVNDRLSMIAPDRDYDDQDSGALFADTPVEVPNLVQQILLFLCSGILLFLR